MHATVSATSCEFANTYVTTCNESIIQVQAGAFDTCLSTNMSVQQYFVPHSPGGWPELSETGSADMREEISQATKAAMKAGDKRRLSTLRLISAAIKDRDIAARVDDKGQSTGKEQIEESDIFQLLQKMIKQRRESEATYREAGRSELMEQEAFEISVIEEFLPAQMSEDEIKQAVSEAIADQGAAGLKDMGKTMGALKAKFAGRMDFTKASAIAKEQLS